MYPDAIDRVLRKRVATIGLGGIGVFDAATFITTTLENTASVDPLGKTYKHRRQGTSQS